MTHDELKLLSVGTTIMFTDAISTSNLQHYSGKYTIVGKIMTEVPSCHTTIPPMFPLPHSKCFVATCGIKDKRGTRLVIPIDQCQIVGDSEVHVREPISKAVQGILETYPSDLIQQALHRIESPTPDLCFDMNISGAKMTTHPLPFPKLHNVEVSYVPDKNPNYISWGHHADIKRIIKSRLFYPCYVTGHSGNGKSEMIQQICQSLSRECVRVNITAQTNEDDLIGMYTLQNGSYHWIDGPVLIAMKRGAVVLLDEIDSGRPDKMFCLQAALEGKAIFVKKQNVYVYPKEGFNIVATANTKGRGSDDGRYIGTQMQNAAFLDRFAVCFEQSFPTESVEKKILMNYYQSMTDAPDEQFVNNLIHWASQIRNAFHSNAIDDLISTRRLINIIKSYVIFSSKKKAIQYSVNMLSDESRRAFLAFYESIDATFINEETKEVDDD